jgi:hypothetical protein
MSIKNTRGRVIGRLHELALMGARHPDAISYGLNRDCFDHRLVLETISPDHAEALRLHRELVDDGIPTPPRQTSRRMADGSRWSLQVQRVSARQTMAALKEISDRVLSPEYVSVICPKCPHRRDDDVAPWDDPEHLALLEQRHAELRVEKARADAARAPGDAAI